MSDFAKRLRQLRGSRPREEFAKLLGINPRSLVNYEQGERLPKIDVAELICSKTGVSTDWLISGKGEPPDLGGVTANLLAESPAQNSQHIDIARKTKAETANVSNADGTAVAMLRREVEQLNQEIARLFQDKREMARHQRELLLEIDDKAALIGHHQQKINELAQEIERLREGKA